jgi:hypothetical protein
LTVDELHICILHSIFAALISLPPKTACMYFSTFFRKASLCMCSLVLLGVSPAMAQLSGTKTIAPTGDYPTLAAAIAHIQSVGLGGAIVLELDNSYNPATEPLPLRLPAIPSASGTHTITIRPKANVAAAKTFATTTLDTVVNINGGNYYKIDGRPGGVGIDTFLRFTNTSTMGCVLAIGRGANGNTVRYCSMRGSASESAVIRFLRPLPALGIGHHNDTISHCYISSMDGIPPQSGIYVQGVTAYPSNNITISDCNISDFSTNGVLVAGSAAVPNIAIERNSFYQTSSIASLPIAISAANLGNNTITVRGNFIGGRAPLCGGSACTATTATSINLIDVGSTSGSSRVSSNKIANIAVSSGSTISDNFITVDGGAADSNTIGSISATPGSDTIWITANSLSTSMISVLNTTSCSYNNIGAVNMSATAGTLTFRSILAASIGNASTSNNIIGGPVANSIYATSASADNCTLTGIISSAPDVSHNIVRNMTCPSSGGGSLWGIQSTNAFATVSGNTVHSHSCASTNLSGTAVSLGGIVANTAGDRTITGNTIYDLRSTATSAAVYVAGVLGVTNGYNHVIDGNFIHSISAQSSSATVSGIQLHTAINAVYRVSNNMIRLGIDASGASHTIGHKLYGIYESNDGTHNHYHNSVYIGGTGVSGSAVSAAFYTDYNNTREISNNIFTNVRSNGAGSGLHYAIRLGSAVSSATLDYNLYHHNSAPGAGSYLGRFNGNDYTALGGWQGATSKDAASQWGAPLFINPTGGTGTIDLHLDYRTPAESAGSAWVAVTTDYDGQTRSALSPVDIGADADDFAAGVWEGATSTDWNTAGNWRGNAVPLSAETAVLPATGVVNEPSLANNTTVGGLVVKTGRTLTIAGGNTLSVTGSLSNNGIVTGTGTVALTGSSAQSIAGTGTINNLTLNNAAGAIIATEAQVNLTGTYTPTDGALTTNGKLTLKSSATSTARIAQGSNSGGYISGDVTVERYVPGGRRAFRFFGHPFSTSIPLSQFSDDLAVTGAGGATNGFYPSATNNASAYYYNPSQGIAGQSNDPGWQAYTSAHTNSWDRYEGMRLLVRGAGDEGVWVNNYTPSAVTIDWKGPLNQGTQTINLIKGTSSGINMVSNPYASPVILGTALDAMADKDGATYWVWNPMLAGTKNKGAYVPLLIGAAVTDAIPSGSAVVVKVLNNTTLTVSESNKATAATVEAFRTTAMNNMAELHVFDTTGVYYDRIYVRADAASAGAKEQLDGEKFNNPGINFYTWNADNQKLSLDTRPFVHGDVIPLGFSSTEQQPFIIEVMSNEYPAGTQLALHDKYLNTVTPLDMGVRYRFEVTGDTLSQGDNRFELGVTVMAPPVTGVKEVVQENLLVNCTPNPATSYIDLSIMSSEVANTTVSIYDISGSIAYRQALAMLRTG